MDELATSSPAGGLALLDEPNRPAPVPAMPSQRRDDGGHGGKIERRFFCGGVFGAGRATGGTGQNKVLLLLFADKSSETSLTAEASSQGVEEATGDQANLMLLGNIIGARRVFVRRLGERAAGRKRKRAAKKRQTQAVRITSDGLGHGQPGQPKKQAQLMTHAPGVRQ
jgi:hypothetical protein